MGETNEQWIKNRILIKTDDGQPVMITEQDERDLRALHDWWHPNEMYPIRPRHE